MQNYCKTIGALAAASALVAGNALAGTPAPVTAPASAPESGIDYELHVGYTSEYLFRGVDYGLDLVESGFDIATELYGVGLSAGVWYANYDASSTLAGPLGSLNSSVNEIDLYTEASYDFSFVKASLGYIYYYNDQDDINEFLRPGALGDTQEVYFGLSRDFGFAEASLTYFWDVAGDNDGYTELGLTRSFELAPCVALNLGSNVSYVIEPGEFGAWTTKVGIDWSFTENAKLSPFVALAIPLSDEVGTAYQGSDNEFVGGSMLSVSF